MPAICNQQLQWQSLQPLWFLITNSKFLDIPWLVEFDNWMLLPLPIKGLIHERVSYCYWNWNFLNRIGKRIKHTKVQVSEICIFSNENGRICLLIKNKEVHFSVLSVGYFAWCILGIQAVSLRPASSALIFGTISVLWTQMLASCNSTIIIIHTSLLKRWISLNSHLINRIFI